MYAAQLLWASSQPVLKIVLLCSCGAWCARNGMLSQEGRKVLSGTSYYIFSPCLIFMSMAPVLSRSHLVHWFPIMVNMVVTICVGLLLGYSQLPLLKPPRWFRNHIVVCIGLGNTVTFPIVMVSTIASGTNNPLLQGMDPKQASSLAVGYVMVGVLVAATTHSLLGFNMLRKDDSQMDDEQLGSPGALQEQLLLGPQISSVTTITGAPSGQLHLARDGSAAQLPTACNGYGLVCSSAAVRPPGAQVVEVQLSEMAVPTVGQQQPGSNGTVTASRTEAAPAAAEGVDSSPPPPSHDLIALNSFSLNTPNQATHALQSDPLSSHKHESVEADAAQQQVIVHVQGSHDSSTSPGGAGQVHQRPGAESGAPAASEAALHQGRAAGDGGNGNGSGGVAVEAGSQTTSGWCGDVDASPFVQQLPVHSTPAFSGSIAQQGAGTRAEAGHVTDSSVTCSDEHVARPRGVTFQLAPAAPLAVGGRHHLPAGGSTHAVAVSKHVQGLPPPVAVGRHPTSSAEADQDSDAGDDEDDRQRLLSPYESYSGVEAGGQDASPRPLIGMAAWSSSFKRLRSFPRGPCEPWNPHVQFRPHPQPATSRFQLSAAAGECIPIASRSELHSARSFRNLVPMLSQSFSNLSGLVMTSSSKLTRSKSMRKALKLSKVMGRELLSPPVITCFLSVIVGCTPAIQAAMFDPGKAKLRLLSEAMQTLADCCIPCQMMVLGATLAFGPGDAKVPWATIVNISCCRFVIMPLIGCSLVMLAYVKGWFQAPDPVFLLVLLMHNTVPTAVNVQTMASVHQHGDKEIASILFYQYLACIPVMAIATSVFMYLVTEHFRRPVEPI